MMEPRSTPPTDYSLTRGLVLCFGAALVTSCLYGRYDIGLVREGAGAGGETEAGGQGGPTAGGAAGAAAAPSTSSSQGGDAAGNGGQGAAGDRATQDAGHGGEAITGHAGADQSEGGAAGDDAAAGAGTSLRGGATDGGSGVSGGSGDPAVTSGVPGVAGSSAGVGGTSLGGGGAGGGGSDGGGEGACETCGGDDCVDLGTSLDHCGACGRECSTLGVATPVCQAGVCTSTCRAGYGNCNEPDGSLPDDGCETNTASEIYNCGACGRECLTAVGVDELRCGGGVCTSTCLGGYANVNRPPGSALDHGCEVDTSTNVDHCGAVDRPCSSTQVAERRCDGGVCTSTCASGRGNSTQPAAPALDDGCEASCPATGGPAMVRLPEGYCIDSTEVTQGQYQEWLDEQPPTTGQASECTWNTSYEPTCDWTPETKANHPVVCVDWCDAYAYCLAVGKRLCGKIGGGANEYSDYADASQSQWYHACVSGDADNRYPYGDSYEPDTCNDTYYGVGATVQAGSLSDCQSSVSGYVGVYDLSGNVYEWEDSCDGQAGPSDRCRLRGGSFSPDDIYVRCDNGDNYSRVSVNGVIGFRCCAP